jgi:hypothetical protein
MLLDVAVSTDAQHNTKAAESGMWSVLRDQHMSQQPGVCFGVELLSRVAPRRKSQVVPRWMISIGTVSRRGMDLPASRSTKQRAAS